MTRDDIIRELYRIASELVCGRGMPPEFLNDWDYRSKCPQSVEREIVRRTKLARETCGRHAEAIAKVIDQLGES